VSKNGLKATVLIKLFSHNFAKKMSVIIKIEEKADSNGVKILKVENFNINKNKIR